MPLVPEDAKVWGLRVLGIATFVGAVYTGVHSGLPWVTKGELAGQHALLQAEIAELRAEDGRHRAADEATAAAAQALAREVHELQAQVAADHARLEIVLERRPPINPLPDRRRGAP